MDGSVFLFAACASLGTVLIFALSPAVRVMRASFQKTPHSDSPGRGSSSSGSLSASLVAVEVAVSITLLVSARATQPELGQAVASRARLQTRGRLELRFHAAGRSFSRTSGSCRLHRTSRREGARRAGRGLGRRHDRYPLASRHVGCTLHGGRGGSGGSRRLGTDDGAPAREPRLFGDPRAFPPPWPSPRRAGPRRRGAGGRRQRGACGASLAG